MKIKEDSPAAVRPTRADTMDNSSYPSYNKSSGPVQMSMDTARKKDGGQQVSSDRSTGGTQCRRSSDLSLASTMGEFDVTVMQPIFPQYERGMANVSQGMTVGADSSGDEFSAEILSPMSAPTYGVTDITSPMRQRRTDLNDEVAGIDRHVVGTASESRSIEMRRQQEMVGINRTSRRFLSSEPIRSASELHGDARANKRIYDDSESRDVLLGTSDYRYGDCGSDVVNTSFSDASSSNVMLEIDLAVSMAHTRFKNISTTSGNELESRPQQSQLPPYEVQVSTSDRSAGANMTAELHTNQQTDACRQVTKDYASHNMSARLTEDEWKRKPDYGRAGPAALDQRVTFEQSRIREMAHRLVVRGETYSAAGCDRNCGSIEVVPSESAPTEPSTLPFDTKINSVHDERNITSYAVGEPLHLQSSRCEANWPHTRAYEKQVIGRSRGKCTTGREYTEGLEIDNKPINLCLQQGKHRDTELGPSVTSLKQGKVPEFRKCARSFSARDKPYLIPKRRTRSQCAVSPESSNPLSNLDSGYTGNNAGTSRQVNIRDMGIDNRAGLENYSKESASYPGQSISDCNSANLFSPTEPSHMMVQDEAKTYAILSGRRNEELMNPNVLSTSVSPLQQQSQYQHARPSHSIINYVGHHGQSPDLRTSEMSPSPPVRDHRATPSSSLPGMLQHVIVAPRQHQHSASPSHRDEFRGHEMFQRQYESPTTHYDSGIQDTRHQLQHHHSLALGHHPGTSTFSPLHMSPPQHHPHQQASQYLIKQHQKKEYFDNLPSHSGLGTPGAMLPAYAGSLQVSQHHGYLKPPPVDLDDLSEEERERMRVKRERNRVAAAKCRNRRRELLERLEKEAEQLEREQELLRENVRRLRVQKMQLGNMLEEHEPTCQNNVAEEDTNSPSHRTSPDDQIKSSPAVGLEGGESSTPKNTNSPAQMTTQA